jgi:adenine-specific DNA-methyltransferase
MATNNKKSVEAFKHDDAKRKNIPSAEQQSFVQQDQQEVKKVRYPRNTDLDPQFVWRGKDEQDWSDLVVNAPPLYIQEKVHPKALIDELLRQSQESEFAAGQITADLFSDFNGIPKDADKTEFYTHDQNWTNRMILGDSLQVMASLAEREGLRGKVQCIYFDPPYGIKFNSNFQWSTTSRDVKDGNSEHITREPEQVKAFRDTWRDGIHSYLTYLRDRLTLARDLLTDSGSIFVQIGDENVHRVRALLDEIFGDTNQITQITYQTTAGRAGTFLSEACNYILWFSKDKEKAKFRTLYQDKSEGSSTEQVYSQLLFPDGTYKRISAEQRLNPKNIPEVAKVFRTSSLTSQSGGTTTIFPYPINGKVIAAPKKGGWKTNFKGIEKLEKAGRLLPTPSGSLNYIRMLNDFPVIPYSNIWTDTGTGSFTEDKIYVVQTGKKVIERCILMASDPGDLVLDPTCGSGTTATVAEQWGRRWITIDTSRVALALARSRIMGSRYQYYLLSDSRDGQLKVAEVTNSAPSSQTVYENIRHGFVYQGVPHITLKSIANNSEIDVIWEQWQLKLESLREKLNTLLNKSWQAWEIPREVDPKWLEPAKLIHSDWWKTRIERQLQIDASISAKAEFEYLYDKPFEDKKKVRVAGPFTVESLSPHRMIGVDENDELINVLNESKGEYSASQTFEQMVLENLKSAGVQQANKADRINFISLVPWPGSLVCAEGRYFEGAEIDGKERRAAVFIGPEFGTVQRADLVAAAREAAEAGFDALIACAFNYEAHATEFNKLGSIPVLKSRMNADLHMAEDLKNTGKGNLFVIFGEPDITVQNESDGRIRVKVNGVDVFKPQTGEVISDGADGIACWFIDTDYNEESFFVRHAYFLGANDPYNALKTTLKAEINADAWATLNSDTSRPFDKPKNGRFAVKVINHLGDEVMKVFKV